MDDTVRALFERVRQTAESMGDAAGVTARAAGKYAGGLLDAAKLNMRIFDLNTEVSTLLREIGQSVYDAHKGAGVDDAALDERLRAIGEKKTEIESLRARINALRGSRPCPRCGADCGREDAYCRRCGGAL